jgi:hypothetical protein
MLWSTGPFRRTFPRILPVALVSAWLLPCGFATAQTPVYTTTFGDAVTGDNAFVATDGFRRWDIDPGADSYQNDVYERPTAQTYTDVEGVYATDKVEYYENLDIVQARAGFDDDFLYVAIDLYGLDKSTADGVDTVEGLVYRYGIRIGTDPDGTGGFLLVTDQPLLKNGTTYGGLGTFGYQDTNLDVGGTGLTVTKQDVPGEVSGDGYETVVISDGKTGAGAEVLFSRVDPNDASIVEIAIDYEALGFDQDDLMNLAYLVFESIKGGPKDPANYLWNDEYNHGEAGSPYPGAPGSSISEFGTQGLGNIYELDTLNGGGITPVPEPATLLMLLPGLAGLMGHLRGRLN